MRRRAIILTVGLTIVVALIAFTPSTLIWLADAAEGDHAPLLPHPFWSSIVPPATISGTVFDDLDGNGVQDAGEPGIAGVVVSCINGGTTVTDTTDYNGDYIFTRGLTGDYTVRETDPPGYVSTTPNEVNVSITMPGQEVTVNFGDQQQPDLIVKSIDAPDSAQPGETIVVANTIRNQGDGAAGSFVVKFYLSTNVKISAADTYLGRRTIGSLAAGASDSANTSLTIPGGTAPGDYYLGAIADANRQVAESDETNNTGYDHDPITIVIPDLIVKFIDAPASAQRGETVVVTNTIRNQGDGDAGSFVVKFYLSRNTTISSRDTYLGRRTISNLAAGASDSANTNLTIPGDTAPGVYYLGAIADANGDVAESNERNNTGYDMIIIIGRPDLIVQSINAPVSAGQGETVSVANTIHNRGDGDAGSFVVKFYLSTNTIISSRDTYLGRRTIGSLAAGASDADNTSLTIPFWIAPGTYYLGAIADANHQVAESNEANNTGYDSDPIAIVMPDLIVHSINAPDSAPRGETVVVANTIMNQGGADAGSFVVKFYLSTNDTISSGDTYLGRRTIGSLAAGASNSADTSLTIPWSGGGGTYYLGAIADANDEVAEDDEGNNTGCDAIDILAPVYLSLNVEDALEGVPVNKVVGDLDGPTRWTRVEIVAKLLSFSSASKDDIPVVLTIPGNLFGSPTDTWVRNTNGGALTNVGYDNLGGGQYQVTTDLSRTCFLGFCLYHKQIVWRFEIPNDTSPQDVVVNAQVQMPCVDPSGSGTIRILAPENVRSLIIANRKLLYDKYTHSGVTNLLSRLFTEAQGPPASHTPPAVIYYVERYDGRARDWDNTDVDYDSSATANETADAIDDLIEDWHDDATLYVDIDIPFGGTISFPVAWPNYLLVVGDDDTIPFYRYDDPSNDEGINVRRGCPAADGWCVDSATNPAIRATDEDYILTDNPYADLGGGTTWQTGDIELWVGRLVGASAADMLSLLEEGVSWDNGKEGGVVMASVDGWELGLEHDPGGAGHIADLYDVPALFRGKGFAVRNDDIPGAEVRTIDVMGPYEGGSASWNTNFRSAANAAAGMDLFFIGGHDSYDHACIPGDDFSPDDTCAAAACRYHRFDNDHPIAMIVGCHGGLPVPDIDVPGGVDHDMVYDLVHEGVSAYIGATGFSYGSPNNLHKCTWGERLIQRFFGRLLMPPGGNSMTIGKAMAEAKRNYVFGLGGSDSLDRKTVTEFNVYGVPWTFIYYPGGGAAALAAGKPEERGFTTLSGPVGRVADAAGIYTRTFEVDIEAYTAVTETQAQDSITITYDLLSIAGGDLAIADGDPILPYVQGYTMTLPFSGTVTNVQVMSVITFSEPTYNIPTALVGPWTEEGLVYTTTTTITTPYPADVDLVQYQQTGEGILFTVFPIQHNPTSDETTFYRHFEVQVIYESPLAVAVTEFTTDKAQYRPGDTISTTARIENVGDVTATLTATLTIRDEGQVVDTTASDPFTVTSGGSYVLPLAWSGALDDGPYSVQITLWSEGAVVGGDSADISVLSGEVTSLTAPETIFPWEEGTFQVSFANYRGVTVTAQISLTIQGSEGGLVEEITPQAITVTGGLTGTVTFSWTPTGVKGGDYNAVATVAVEDQGYGSTARAFEVESIADLLVQEINAPGLAQPGEMVSVTYRIKDRGNVNAENFTVGFYISTDETITTTDTLLDSRDIISLTAGASLWEEINLTILTSTVPGSYYLGAIVDSGQSVTESNETNNTLYDSIALAGQPDLAVQGIDAPASAQVGATVLVTGTIVNQGDDDAGSFDVEFYLSADASISTTDIYLGSQSITSLTASASLSEPTGIVIPMGTAPGNYYLGAVADANNTAAESNETNNTYSRDVTMSILGRPDLIVQGIEVPALTLPGATVLITDTIMNQGNADAGSFDVEFYLSADDIISTTDIYLGSQSITSLTAGVSLSGTTTLTMPVGIEAGNYYIGAIADAGNSVAELDETNNTNTSEVARIGEYLCYLPTVMRNYGKGYSIYLPVIVKGYGS